MVPPQGGSTGWWVFSGILGQRTEPMRLAQPRHPVLCAYGKSSSLRTDNSVGRPLCGMGEALVSVW